MDTGYKLLWWEDQAGAVVRLVDVSTAFHQRYATFQVGRPGGMEESWLTFFRRIWLVRVDAVGEQHLEHGRLDAFIRFTSVCSQDILRPPSKRLAFLAARRIEDFRTPMRVAQQVEEHVFHPRLLERRGRQQAALVDHVLA